MALKPTPAGAPKPGAAKPAARTTEAAEAEPDKASDLDELTHAEFRLIYDDATRNLLFAKRQQWRMVEYASILAIALIGLASGLPFPRDVARFCAFFLLGAGFFAIVILLFLQAWQYREQGKLRRIVLGGFSTQTARLLGIRDTVGRDMQRYVILGTMVLYILVLTLIGYRIVIDVGAA